MASQNTAPAITFATKEEPVRAEWSGEATHVSVEIAGGMVTKIAAHLDWFTSRAVDSPESKVGAGTVRRMALTREEADSLSVLLVAHAEGKGTGKSLGPARRIQRTLARVQSAIASS